jgi:glycerol-3-phosphate dehydrogenase
MSLKTTSRTETRRQLESAPLDVLVIGGGIVGAGVARDAAMRGLRVGLVEQHDFAFGTSSRSSRLLHGGLRYLAQGRIGLVHQASVEKKVIHRIAPHLAQPLPFLFPTYRGNRQWVLWQLKLGVKVYDALCGGRNFANSTWLSRQELLRKVPGLKAEGLQGGVRYYDGFTNDARLTLDTLRSAARDGAMVLNYCRFIQAGSGLTWDCEVEDRFEERKFAVKAHAVVNAGGPWAETVPHSRVKLRLTKGVHLVLPKSRLPVEETVVMTDGARILFAIPWGERTILGTTDTDYDGALDDVRADGADIEYLLRIANGFFANACLIPADIVSTWAGLRPLVADPSGKPSDISRAHEITQPEPLWWEITGGKLTTYRLMAEEAVDRIARELRSRGLNKQKLQDCRTASEPLLPGAEVQGVSGLLPPTAVAEAVDHYCSREWALHLDDVMVRRSGWHYYRTDRCALAERVALRMAALQGWSEPVRQRELEIYLGLCSDPTGPGLSPASSSSVASA